jgi:hypothetical protein
MLAGRVVIVKDRIAKIDFSGCHDMIVLNFGGMVRQPDNSQRSSEKFTPISK